MLLEGPQEELLVGQAQAELLEEHLVALVRVELLVRSAALELVAQVVVDQAELVQASEEWA